MISEDATTSRDPRHAVDDRVKWISRPFIKKFIPYLRWLAISSGVLVLSGTVAYIVGAPALPGGQLFGVVVLLVAGALAAVVAQHARFPSLLGPLVAGVVLRSTGVVHLEGQWLYVAATARKVAVVLILLRVGLGLDAQALRRHALILSHLAVIPPAAEAAMVMAVSHQLLRLPWMWGAMAGAMMASVSPAVVVPSLVRYQEQGFGVQQGLPSLLVGGTAIGVVTAILQFEILFPLVFVQGSSPWEGMVNGLLALLIGVGFGFAWGVFVGYVRSRKDSHTIWLRSLLLLIGGMLAVFGGSAAGFNASGPIAAPIAALVATVVWNRRQWPYHGHISTYFRLAWMVWEVVIFALIGTDVDVTALHPKDVGLCTAVLFTGVMVRIVITVVVSFSGGFVWREKLFMAIAGFPKATTQAALGPAALEASRRLALGETAEAQATQILTLAALAILLTAPLGAIILELAGPRLLSRQLPSINQLHEREMLNQDRETQPEMDLAKEQLSNT